MIFFFRMSTQSNECNNILIDGQGSLTNMSVLKKVTDKDKNDGELKSQCKIENEESIKLISSDSVPQVAVSNQSLSVTSTKPPARIMPIVLVQAPSNIKVPTSLGTGATSISTPIIVNANSQFVNTFNTKLSISTKSSTTMSSVVLTPTANTNKPTQIILQKTGNGTSGQTLIPVSVATSTGTKQTFAYLGALLKNSSQVLSSKPGESQIVVPTNHLPAGLVPAPTNQKLVLTPMTMPKLSSRLPTTCPTTCINQPKIANIILPIPLNQTKPTTQSVINFKISNGQIQADPKGTITVLKKPEIEVPTTLIEKKESDTPKSVTEVVINSSVANNSQKMQTNKVNQVTPPENSDKQYELSIPEEPNSKVALNYTIKLSEDMKTYKIEQNGQEINAIKAELTPHEEKCPIKVSTPSVIVHPKQETHRKPLHEASILKKCNISTNERKTYPSKVSVVPKPENTSMVTSEKLTNANPVPAVPEVKKSGTERRRKSQYTYLRDYDEIVVTSGNAWEDKEDKEDKNKGDKGNNNNTFDSLVSKVGYNHFFKFYQS